MARRPGRRILVALAVVLLVAGLALTAVCGLQRQLIYFPDATDVAPAAEALPGARDVTLRTSDGLELGAWYLPADAAGDTGMAVLMAPGNGGNRAGRTGLARHLSDRGLNVLMVDYRGYGGNPGSPTEKGLAADADAAVRALTDLGHPLDRTIFFGESLGTGVVAGLQQRHRPAGIVLRSPFTELADVGSHHYRWLPVRTLLRDRFPVLDPLAASNVPLTVIYGDRDSVVPSELSARVADGVPSLVERVVLRGADHNDAVMFGSRVAEAVERLAREVG
ncbi:alpha/beta hydrolase [Nocardioides sp. zg-1308]|uniref:alpha/beta hydrolase n=1 Tax=Nocardioides sp. zg-1308 TaxID=2736253 RepID=UPI00155327A3|nr:alpha/beta hydrolase [Nocardioides sp. zg-1308]NPD03790.1 alpha/beta hydrolase [Nocardioides sp. zg-1308]